MFIRKSVRTIHGPKIFDIRVVRKPRLPVLPVPEKTTSVFLSMLRVMPMMALGLVIVLIILPAFSAFEAHIVSVSATPVKIDPPILTIPGAVPWFVAGVGSGLTGDHVIDMTAPDVDATHIFYTFGAGTDPSAIPDPECGGALGGPKTPTSTVTINDDTVIKAIACNDDSAFAQSSLVNTKIYSFCESQEVDFPQNLAVFSAGGASSLDDVLMAADATVNGNVRSNNDLRAQGSGDTRVINGDVFVVGDLVDPDNFTISGTTNTNESAQSLPDLDLPFWEGEAADAGTIEGNLVIPASLGGSVSLGPSEITGSLAIGSDNTIEIAGTLYVHGNLSINSDVTLAQHSAYGNDFAIIIVEGKVDIASNVNFDGSGSSGALILVSKAGAQAGNDAAIETATSSTNLGDVVLFAQNGDIHIHSNRTLLAAFAAAGGASGNPAVRLASNVTVQYRLLPTAIGCGAKFPLAESLVINEFLPNPAGDDNAAKPNGEWVELYNGSQFDIDVAGWVLYDSNDAHELFITASSTNSGNTIIQPKGYLVVYRDGDPDFTLNNDSDSVRLYTKEISAGGILIDQHDYDYGGVVPDDKSFSRTPDGSPNWVDPEPTPGEPNVSLVAQVLPEELVFPDDPEEEPFETAALPAASSSSEDNTQAEIPDTDLAEVAGEPTKQTESSESQASPEPETATEVPAAEPAASAEPQITDESPTIESTDPADNVVELVASPVEEAEPARLSAETSEGSSGEPAAAEAPPTAPDN